MSDEEIKDIELSKILQIESMFQEYGFEVLGETDLKQEIMIYADRKKDKTFYESYIIFKLNIRVSKGTRYFIFRTYFKDNKEYDDIDWEVFENYPLTMLSLHCKNKIKKILKSINKEEIPENSTITPINMCVGRSSGSNNFDRYDSITFLYDNKKEESIHTVQLAGEAFDFVKKGHYNKNLT